MSLIDATCYPSKRPTMSGQTPIVFVVDDDISVRESLELLITNQGWQPALFESAQEFLARRPTVAPGCLILDVNLPDLNGLDLQRQISGSGSALPVIFVTGYGDIPMTVQAMKAGAVEFLTKPFDESAMIDAIQSALIRSREALERETQIGVLQDRFSSLSKREREVMTLVVKGLMNKQVGGELDISEITVKAHRGRVMQKMQATNFVELVNMAAELGIATRARD
jgi:FixJ family two-component response regulator